MSKVILANIIVFSYQFGLCNHRVILVDFKLSNTTGHRVRIYSLEIRRLIYKNKAVVEKYNAKALKLLQFYKIDEKLDRTEEN